MESRRVFFVAHMTMENQPFQDAFPIDNWDFPSIVSHLSLGGFFCQCDQSLGEIQTSNVIFGAEKKHGCFQK